jgi:type VI secretion system secreted protein Hcp
MASDIFLELDGIKGESKDAKHFNEIEIYSFSWGATQLGSDAPQGSGKVSVSDFSLGSRVSKASPQLMLACATGKHIPAGLITVRKAAQKPLEYYVIKMTDVLVSSYQSEGSSSGVPTDQFSLNYAKIEFSYYPQKADGSLGPPVTAAMTNPDR